MAGDGREAGAHLRERLVCLPRRMLTRRETMHPETDVTAAQQADTRVSVIIVNYGTADLVIAGVNSVLEQAHPGLAVDVHVVDNASPGDDATVLAAAMAQPGWARHVTLYPEAVNHGFGRGNNVAFDALASRATPPDYVFLLNPDARLKNDALVRLAAFLDAHPKVAIAGAKIEKPGDGVQVAAFRFPSLASEFVKGAQLGPVSRLLAHKRVSLDRHIPEQKVDWVAGAAMMARFSVIRQLKGFDPAFFLYFEEVELMHRVAAMGLETWYVPDAVVEHEEGAATQLNKESREELKRKPRYWFESYRHYHLATGGRFYAVCAATVWILGALIRACLALLRGKTNVLPPHFFRDMWQIVLRPLLGFGGRGHA